MKLKGIHSHMSLACMLLLSSGTGVYAGTMGAETAAPNDAVYLGFFGGGGAVTSGRLSQEGTAFYTEANGGPLAVNATGAANSSSEWIVGGQVGYQWAGRSFNHINPNWSFAPAAELEGYYLGGATLQGNDLNNGTTRLTEHDFYVSYPLHTGVFLVNAVLNANHSNFSKFHPYVGVGAGAAVISITGANSTQNTPAEPGINHYNSDTSDTSIAFAAQPKIGVSFDLGQHTNMFVEYRFLYLSATDFGFGSTVYPSHVATSNWDVKVGSQYYNMGTIGIKYDL